MSNAPTPPVPERLTRRRGRIIAAFLAICALGLVVRLVQIQLVQHSAWSQLATAIQESTIEIPPKRGTIRDRNGTPLALDIKAMAIAVDSYNMTKPETLVDILTEELDARRSTISDLVYRTSYFTWIDRAVDLEAARRIEQRADAAGAYGLIFFDAWKRCYPQGRLASNLIGFVGTDGEGLEGIELEFDDTLRGSPALIHVVQGADERTYQLEVLDAGTPGVDIDLTIDAKLQFICEEEIERGVSKFRADAGMIVAVDPGTGEVLAMAQDKGYDLNTFWTSTVEERRNLAVTHLFEPGSIFKVFSGLAALEAGVVTVSDTFNGDDGITVAGHVMHNSEFDSFGTVTFGEIIENSINTGMIQVAQRLGIDPFQAFLSRLGFGEPTGIELPGEERGILRDPEDWTALDLAAASIGQSVAVTGIQLARGLAAVAANGILPTPSIVQSGATSPVRVASEAGCSTMRNLMQRVVESGTGTLAAIDGFPVAGKTGTAQKATPGRGYVDEKYTSLFAGILPADDPEIVFVVILDEVKTTPVWGGYTAGQIFREAATRYTRLERLAPVAYR